MCCLKWTRLRELRVRLIRKFKEEPGAELVEAAVVIPILLMLLLGIFTFGRAYNVYQTITRAAREGAKAAVLPPCALYASGGCPGSNAPYTTGQIWSQFVQPTMQSANLLPSSDPALVSQVQNSYTLKYTYIDPPTNSVCGVKLSLQYPYTLTLPFTSLNLSQITLSTSVQMRLENQTGTCLVGQDYNGG